MHTEDIGYLQIYMYTIYIVRKLCIHYIVSIHAMYKYIVHTYVLPICVRPILSKYKTKPKHKLTANCIQYLLSFGDLFASCFFSKAFGFRKYIDNQF